MPQNKKPIQNYEDIFRPISVFRSAIIEDNIYDELRILEEIAKSDEFVRQQELKRFIRDNKTK